MVLANIERSDSAGALPAREQARSIGSAARVARNTGLITLGTVIGRLMTLGLYVVMARKLGRHGFGDFSFALSLAVFVTVSSLGTDFAITREVARDADRVNDLFGNVIVIRIVTGIVAVLAAVGISYGARYSGHVKEIVPVVAVATWLDVLSASGQAVLRGLEDMRPIAAAWILERGLVAVFASAALLVGAGLLAVSGIYLAGSVAGLLYVSLSLVRRGFRPRWGYSREDARALLIDSLPLAAVSVSVTLLARLDGVILSLFKGDSAIGIYSAAYRPYEGVLIIPLLFGLAAYPVLSRLSSTTTPAIAEAFEKGCKALAFVTVPAGAGLAIFAAPVVDDLYGHAFRASAFPLRMMGISLPVWGLLLFATFMLAAQDHQRVAARALIVGLAVNVAANLALIPRYSYDGAAVALAISIAAIASVMVGSAVRISGPIRPLRVILGPVLGTSVMVSMALVLGANTAVLIGSLLAYAAVTLAVERALFREDLLFVVQSLKRGVMDYSHQPRRGRVRS